MVAYFLIDNDRAGRQYRAVRRNGERPSGVVVIHTAENVSDRVGPDTGAENVARPAGTSWSSRP